MTLENESGTGPLLLSWILICPQRLASEPAFSGTMSTYIAQSPALRLTWLKGVPFPVDLVLWVSLPLTRKYSVEYLISSYSGLECISTMLESI